METKQFNYNLPSELIAQIPLAKRDQSKLLIVNSINQTIKDSTFVNIVEEINQIFNLSSTKKLLFIGNDTRVFPARIRIQRKSGARGEVFILEKEKDTNIACLIRPLKKLRVGEILYADNRTSSAELTPLFKVDSLAPPLVTPIENSLESIINEFGEMPLPPYIVRDPTKVSQSEMHKLDAERYQTVYSNSAGSVAAPTAGLHFSENLLEKCAQNNIEFCFTTLHVGLGTFLPVTADQISEHKMHAEYYSLSKDVLLKIAEYLQNNQPIIFIGTTSFRAVESYFRLLFPNEEATNYINLPSILLQKLKGNELKNSLLQYADTWQTTNLFIHPSETNYKFLPAIGNALLTNFHQPESTLVMLVASLLGYDFWHKVYSHATYNKYRFLSYGDSSLIIFNRGLDV